MGSQNSYMELGAYANALIHNKARQLIGKAGFTWADLDDIEQELALDLLVRLKNYDPNKSKLSTFMTRIVEHRMTSLIQERFSKCRDWRACQESLDEPISEESGDLTPRIEALPDSRSKTKDALAFEIDLNAALENLPADLRRLWDQMLNTKICHIARQTGTPRTTIYYQRNLLRERLRKAGIGNLLGDSDNFTSAPVSKRGAEAIKEVAV